MPATHNDPAAPAVSSEALLEVGVDISDQVPKAIGPQVIETAVLVVTLGREIQPAPVPGVRFENWDTDGRSERGIGGI